MRFLFGDDNGPATKPTAKDAIRDVVMWAVLGWLVFAGVRAIDHPTTWHAPATAEQREALTDR
jgi:hypothetical protein